MTVLTSARKLAKVPLLILSVANRTSQEISDVEVYAVAYAQDGALIPLSGSRTIGAWRLTEKIEANGRLTQHFGVVDPDGIAGMCMIIASYKTADGAKHDNPLFAEWQGAYKAAQDEPVTE